MPSAVVALWSVGVVKARATNECVTNIAMMRTTSCALEGQPSFTMPPIVSRCGATRARNKPNRFIKMVSSGTSTMKRAISVAQAAPISPMRGTPSSRATGLPHANTAGESPGP